MLAAGVGLAVFASEYPEKFRKIRADLPYYIERGTRVFDLASQVGRSIAAKSRNGRFDLMDGFSIVYLGSTRCRVACGLQG